MLNYCFIHIHICRCNSIYIEIYCPCCPCVQLVGFGDSGSDAVAMASLWSEAKVCHKFCINDLESWKHDNTLSTASLPLKAWQPIPSAAIWSPKDMNGRNCLMSLKKHVVLATGIPKKGNRIPQKNMIVLVVAAPVVCDWRIRVHLVVDQFLSTMYSYALKWSYILRCSISQFSTVISRNMQ